MNTAQQSRYLAAMGIPVWRPKAALLQAESEAVIVATPPKTIVPSVPLSAMVEVLDSPKPKPVPAPIPTTVTTPPLVCAGMDWQALQTAVASCERCSLHKTRTKTVFGAGDRQADWMVVGEAPGADEDRQGEPFVGRAGQLLTSMLGAIGLQRSNVYILNMLKCRPPNNRDPLPEEVGQCRGYLERQVELVQPRLILVVGRIAAQHLLQTSLPLGRLRDQVHTLPTTNIPVVVTYHPAYLLRKPLDKRKAWQDLQLAQQVASKWSS